MTTPLERAMKSLLDDIPVWFSLEGDYDLATLMHYFAINTLVAALDRNEIAAWFAAEVYGIPLDELNRDGLPEWSNALDGADAIIAGILGENQ
ncbi:MAG: hypothetical protein FWG25_08540 [Promicromonosporaceae bacterium]|nr:hypothetical protein [Promicromonosporaceae bacterium]